MTDHTEHMLAWPEGVRSRCEMLLSLGLDPHVILRDSITEYGFEVLVLDDEGNEVRDGDELVTEFVPWPNGYADWRLFRIASAVDHSPIHKGIKRCPTCGSEL